MNEPCTQQGCDAGAEAILDEWLDPEPKTFRWWSRSLKFGFQSHRYSLWDKRVMQIIQMFFRFFGPNCSGAGDKNLKMLEPETKISRCWSRSQKFRCPELEPEPEI